MKEAGLKPDFEVILIESQEDAERHKFSGSPMVTVDGVDVDPMSRDVQNYSLHSCRVYIHEGKPSDHPPKEMLLEALRQ